MASIRKLDSGSWQAQVRLKGHSPVSKTFKTKAEAQQWAKLKEKELKQTPPVPDNPIGVVWREFTEASEINPLAICVDCHPDFSHRPRYSPRLSHCGGRQKGAPSGTVQPAFRNRRSVWTVTTKPFRDAHFATFPPGLIEPRILAGSRVGDVVLDPFLGSGTTAQVAQHLGRRWLGC